MGGTSRPAGRLWEPLFAKYGGAEKFGKYLESELATLTRSNGIPLTPSGIGATGVRAAQKALHRYFLSGSGDVFSPVELEALRYFRVVNPQRPTVLVTDGDLRGLDRLHGKLKKLTLSRESVIANAASVGKIQWDGPASDYALGTGFVVAPCIVMTNKHVLKRATTQQDTDDWRLRSDTYPVTISFAEEGGSAARDQGHVVEEIVYVAKSLDLLLFRISPTTSSGTHCPSPLALALTAAPRRGSPVYTIGFPGREHVSSPEALSMQDDIMGGTYGAKKISPGIALDYARGMNIPHDCSTLGGNSGSCLVSMRTHEVLGLHYKGTSKSGNQAIPLWKIRPTLGL